MAQGDFERVRQIENTEEAKRKYHESYGRYELLLSKDDINRILNGGCVAGEIGCGEYTIFLSMIKE